MKAHELELIHADLMAAKSILDSPDGRKENPYMMNLVGYHAQQAIEKSLKAIVRGAGKGDDDLLHSHDMAGLCMEVQAIRPDFSEKYSFIFENARTLYHANELRYGETNIPAFTAKGILFNANKLYYELEKEYTKETGFNRKDIRRIATEHYDTLPKYSVKRPDLEKMKEEAEAEKKTDKDITD